MKLSRSLLSAAFLSLATVVPASNAGSTDSLSAIIESRSAEDRTRDSARHPEETLTFFRVKPGMTVAEGLPGGGWYTRILAPYLGIEGSLYGVNYADRMWPLFSWAKPEFIEQRIASTAEFPQLVAGISNSGVHARGFTFESVPWQVKGTVDRVLLIRALHNLNRFEEQAQTRSRALTEIRMMLNGGGLVGVVQHRAPESATDEWADGSRGYLKQSAVIAMFKEAGFELVAESEINANPKDQPGAEDIVWRLPPSLRGSKDDPKKTAAMQAIGESDRMTLLFRVAPRAPK